MHRTRRSRCMTALRRKAIRSSWRWKSRATWGEQRGTRYVARLIARRRRSRFTLSTSAMSRSPLDRQVPRRTARRQNSSPRLFDVARQPHHPLIQTATTVAGRRSQDRAADRTPTAGELSRKDRRSERRRASALAGRSTLEKDSQVTLEFTMNDGPDHARQLQGPRR